MKLAVLAAADPLNVRTWSGTPYFMTRALQEHFPDLLPISTPRPLWSQYLRRIVRKGTGGRIDLYWDPSLASRDARALQSRLRASHVDAALCIGNAPLSAFLGQWLPTIHVSDATVPLMRDYYREFSRLPKILADHAWKLDSMSVRHARLCLFATEWAARSAIRDYGADPARVQAIPWGANMDSRDIPPEGPTPAADCCHLVFIGVDWERKGGDIAVAATRTLLAAGFPVKLHIVGASPPHVRSDENVTVHGFVNKGTAEGRRAFDEIMGRAGFLFVPTRQDCYGMVFPEANSYGVPVITTQTGGVPDAVQDGVNGHLLPIEAGPEAYADLIRMIWQDRDRYGALRRSSRARFTSALNWDSWLSAVVPLLYRAAPTRMPVPADVRSARIHAPADMN